VGKSKCLYTLAEKSRFDNLGGGGGALGDRKRILRDTRKQSFKTRKTRTKGIHIHTGTHNILRPKTAKSSKVKPPSVNYCLCDRAIDRRADNICTQHSTQRNALHESFTEHCLRQLHYRRCFGRWICFYHRVQ